MSVDLSLLRTEAQARRALLDIEEYDVSLDLAVDDTTFRSVTRIRFSSAGGPTFVDLKPLAVTSVTLNGAPLDAGLLDRGRLPIETQPGANELVVDATMRFRNDGEGLHRSLDPADGRSYVYGMMFMDAAPSVFACFDQPDLKAPYVLHVEAPAEWTVFANAAGTQVAAGRWEFERTAPLSTYFVTLVAGPWHVVEDSHDGIPLGLSARASLARELDQDVAEILDITKASLDELHRLFGIRYAFGKYHQAFVPEFNAGAMENPGCVTFRDPLIFTSRVTRGQRIQRATTIAHEMAHQWFGNLVTPAWWDDLWLNESFAEYLGNRVTADVTEFSDTWVDLSYARRQWGLVADQGPSTHPVAGNGAADAVGALQDFDGISYAKGSAILRQLAASLGDEVFFAGVIDHFERHRFGNATLHDLVESWERAGAGSLRHLTDEWLLKAGPDRLVLDRAAGVVRRLPPADAPADRDHTFRVAVFDGSWRSETLAVSGPETAYSPTGSAVLLDPYDDTWAVTVPDPETLAALPGLLPGVTDLHLRAGVWNGLRSGLHNALVSPADIVDITVASPPVEDPEEHPRRTHAWLLGMVLPLAPAGSRSRIHAALLPHLDHAPGSEEQLGAFRLAVATAEGPAVLRGWLAAPPAGISLDRALRWKVLLRLAQLGAVSREELQAAFDADPAADARVQHTGAICALPDAAAKAYAWTVFTGETDLPNYEIEAAARGMWSGPEDLLEPYVERYFAELPATASVRSGWVLADTAEWFFPAPIRPDVLARAEALAGELDGPLRRRLVDVADRLRRQLAVRTAFPSGG